MSQSLETCDEGNYQFLPGIEPYSCGVRAADGYEILRCTLLNPLPWQDGLEAARSFIEGTMGRPISALCGVELRSPAPFTRQGFLDFNDGYCDLIEEWDLLVRGQNPIARTNVAPAWATPMAPSLYAFSYTMPVHEETRATFVVAGAGELRGGPMLTAQVIRPNDRTVGGLREKAAYVMGAMSRRLEGLGFTWDDVTATSVYTCCAMDAVLGPEVMDVIGAAVRHGLRHYYARPPIDALDYEMDCRGVLQELILEN